MKKLLISLTVVAGLALTQLAIAVPIELIPPSPEKLPDSNPDTEYAALVAAIGTYNTAHPGSPVPTIDPNGAIVANPPIPTGWTAINGQVTPPGDGPTTVGIPAGFDYAILQWDGM